jgi:hypothetical protein
MWMEAWVPGCGASADKGFDGSLHVAAPAAAIAMVAVFETTPPALTVKGTMHPGGTLLTKSDDYLIDAGAARRSAGIEDDGGLAPDSDNNWTLAGNMLDLPSGKPLLSGLPSANALPKAFSGRSNHSNRAEWEIELARPRWQASGQFIV